MFSKTCEINYVVGLYMYMYLHLFPCIVWPVLNVYH